MQLSTRVQLSIMMFLQFFIWGAWFVTLGTYLIKGLSFDIGQMVMAYSTMSWGALLAPFIVGMIADRFFNAERVLAVCHLLGAGFLYYATTVNDSQMFFWILILYALCYNPTLALVNTVSFNQMSDTGKQFPAIRVCGTVGWIVAGISMSSMGIEDTAQPMIIAAGASVALAVFALFLPRTPPAAAGKPISVRDILCLDALVLMKQRSFSVFIIGSVLVCIPLAFYYNLTNVFLNDMGVENVAGKMTMGQMSEVFFLLVMPFFFTRLGVKKMLLIAMLAWTIRYILFAFGNAENLIVLYYGGIVLHGVCFDFFFVTGQIYVDKAAPKHIQARAQGFIAIATYGLGLLLGAWVCKWVGSNYENITDAGTQYDWTSIWLAPAIMAAAIMVLFALLFKEPKLN